MPDDNILSELLQLSEAPPPRDDDIDVVSTPEPWIHQYSALMLIRAVFGSRFFWDDVERLRVTRSDTGVAGTIFPAGITQSDAARQVYLALVETAAGLPDNDAAKLHLHSRLVDAEPEWVPEAEPPRALEQSLEAVDAITGGVALIARTASSRCWFHTSVPPTERREAEWCPEAAAADSRYCARHESDYEHNDFARRAARLRSVERVFGYAGPAILATFGAEQSTGDGAGERKVGRAG